MTASQHLCKADELPEGRARGFALQGIFVLRYRGGVYAYRDASGVLP